MTSSMRWKAICSRGSSSMTPGGVRGLIKRKTPAPGARTGRGILPRQGARRPHIHHPRAIMCTPLIAVTTMAWPPFDSPCLTPPPDQAGLLGSCAHCQVRHLAVCSVLSHEEMHALDNEASTQLLGPGAVL